MKLSIYLTSLALATLVGCSGGGAPKQNPNSTSSPDAKVEVADPEANAMSNKGVGPITSLALADIDQALVEEGRDLFDAKCSACHKMETRYIGPALKGVTERRTPEWIMNMILNPTEMIAQDPLAKKLVGESNGAVMADQSLPEEEARAILEFFRTQK